MNQPQAETVKPLGEQMKPMRQHAEEWCVETGQAVPSYPSKEWEKMYTRWVEYAFSDLGKKKRPRKILK